MAEALAREGEDVSTFTIAQRLLDRHAYGGRPPREALRKAPENAKRKPIGKWLTEVEAIYNLAEGEILDGRRVLFALALVDKHLFRELSRNEFLDALQDEIAQRSELQLSVKGKALLAARRPMRVAVPLLDDAPAENDELDRAILAHVLARRIRRTRGPVVLFGLRARLLLLLRARLRVGPNGSAPQRATLFHVNGPWGSGKTSLLNFVEQELRGDRLKKADRWVVVTFDAWRYQRLDPPWWWLASVLHSGAIRQLWRISPLRATGLALIWLWWRIRDGWIIYILLAASVVSAYFLWAAGFFGTDATSNGEIAQSLAKIAVFVALWWGAIKAFSRWLLSGTSSVGATVLERAPDPMRLVRSRFHWTVKVIHRPVVIFIDDLDRCRPEYVVQLLEGIQTLFIREPVVYVVAADGTWLADAYDVVYPQAESQGGSLTSLGAHHLEKAFQHTVRLARIPDDVRERYWKRIVSGDEKAPPSIDERKEAEAVFDRLTTAGEILDALHELEREQDGEKRIDPYALRLAAAVALEAKSVEADRHSMLDHFAVLLDGNPRAMKKLVNAYGIELETRLTALPADEQALRQLALWTIVSLRWPALAEYLESHPDDIEAACRASQNGAANAAQGVLSTYLDTPGVRDILEGKNVDPPVRLDAAAVRMFVGARTSVARTPDTEDS